MQLVRMRLLLLLLLELPVARGAGIFFFWVDKVRIGSRMQCNPTPMRCPGDLLAYRREALQCQFEPCSDATHPPGYVPTPPATPARTDAKFLVVEAYSGPPSPDNLPRLRHRTLPAKS
ncbi:hypothetical protein ACHHYP_15172 [Achlya hypogyna]|uniref:Secreted protein n=1 Tax=Achlya hypogyna TaxID=1202772 RepID=A0A0A7CNJ7_ACHHY|nr:secreted protein [Achlya hypogyna]OQR83069.1 hypothetical protein ACHHYP_15172 [Achlya hypogyna]